MSTQFGITSDVIFGTIITVMIIIGIVSIIRLRNISNLPPLEITLPNVKENFVNENTEENGVVDVKDLPNADRICKEKFNIRLLESPNIVNIPTDKTLTYSERGDYPISAVDRCQNDNICTPDNTHELCMKQPEFLFDGVWKPTNVNVNKDDGTFKCYDWKLVNDAESINVGCVDRKQFFPEVTNQQFMWTVHPRDLNRSCEGAMRNYYDNHGNDIIDTTICANYNINGL
jgi:hypothetical protein